VVGRDRCGVSYCESRRRSRRLLQVRLVAGQSASRSHVRSICEPREHGELSSVERPGVHGPTRLLQVAELAHPRDRDVPESRRDLYGSISRSQRRSNGWDEAGFVADDAGLHHASSQSDWTRLSSLIDEGLCVGISQRPRLPLSRVGLRPLDCETFRIPPLMSSGTILVPDEEGWRRRRTRDVHLRRCDRVAVEQSFTFTSWVIVLIHKVTVTQYQRQLAFAAVVRLKLWEMFFTVISLKYALLAS